ncbi:MAG TPA: helix-turn-helix transcriptional regulator [Solirubrobacteraceae bacterium]|nr:helix-turn-helix transcriptional regulator [Solirubrobacteraceae bacterium]
MNRAKQIRIDRGLGVVEVIERARISPKTLKKIEEGSDVKASALARLAAYYEVQPSSLLAPAVFDDPERSAA